MLSYSGIVNYGKVTLPSVEGWAQSANIVRDPPKSYHTRRMDKVSDTNEITQMAADSPDRYCDAISYYAKGINPMIGVNYGGKYPYRIMDAGAFRPPIWRQEDLMPLSRLPRQTTSAYTCKSLVDYTKRWYGCSTQREIIDNPIKTYCETMKSVQAEPSICRPLVRAMLKDPLAPGIEAPNKCLQNACVPLDRYDDVQLKRNVPLYEFVQCNKSNAAIISKLDDDAKLPTLNHSVPLASNVACPKSLDALRSLTDTSTRPTSLKPTRDTVASYKVGNVVFAPTEDDKEYKNLPPKLQCEPFDGRPCKPFIEKNIAPCRLKNRRGPIR